MNLQHARNLVMLRINLPEVFRLSLNKDKTLIIVSNYAASIVHEMDATNLPQIVDYILNDKKHNGYTFIFGFIEDNLLVVQKREPGWNI